MTAVNYIYYEINKLMYYKSESTTGIIVGSIISSFSIKFDEWGLSFVYCGLVLIVIGLLDLLLLPNLPPHAPPLEG